MEDNEKFRFDSEFVSKNYLITKNVLLTNNHEYLSNLNKFNGRYKQPIYDYNSSIKVLNSQYIRDYFLDYENAKTGYGEIVPKEAVMINSTGVGTLGRVNINYLTENISVDNHVNIIVTKDINPYYLTIFLKSYYGQSQISRYYSGSSGQIEIYAKDFNNFLIAIFSNNFQIQIENLVKTSYKKLEDSKNFYKEAEELLLKELDLVDFIPSDENISIKSFKDSFIQTGRLDSEYFQPKYYEIIEKIKSYNRGFAKLNDMTINYSGGYAFSSKDYLENGDLALIRINNIKNGYLDLSNAIFLPNEHRNLSKKDIVKENDILISMSGSIGLACKIEKNINAMVNQRILKIEIKNFESDVLVLILNSIISSMQLERIGTGGVQTNISSNDILNILIPIIDISIQNQIKEKIRKSFELKEESKRLLDLAKKAVEIAIEYNENKGLEVLNIK